MKLLNRKIVSIMKKTYQIPSVIAMQLLPSTVVLAGSPEPGISYGGGTNTDPFGGGDPLGD